MGDFSQTLDFLGLANPIEKPSEYCSVWSGTEETAFDERHVSILQVRSFPSQVKLEAELTALSTIPNVAIMTTIQERNKIKDILNEFGVKKIETEDQVLFRNAKKKFGRRASSVALDLYIQPTVRDKKSKENGAATRALMDWLRADDLNDRIAMITGNAGFGKTTFCKKLVGILQ